MVKAGYVSVVQGYVRSGQGNSVHIAHTRENAQNPDTVLDNVDDLILCTGFNPALDFLSPALRATLGLNTTDTFQPLLLHREVMHPDTPGLYFVGMYRGPYFAGVELQAVRVEFFDL